MAAKAIGVTPGPDQTRVGCPSTSELTTSRLGVRSTRAPSALSQR